MTLSMYQASVPSFIRGLSNLSKILGMAEAYATAKKIEPTALINARLYPDMLPLARQIQIACDIVKGGAARLAGVEVPSFPDTEATFTELQERIKKTTTFLQALSEKQFEGAEKKVIELKVGGNDMKFEGQTYLFAFVYPNFYFHLSVSYALLRHNGLELGKADFLGSIQ
jgi:hypothetical protein